MQVVNLAQKFAAFQDYFSPKIVGELNNFQVKLVKVQGEFMWHHHDAEDEMFLVTKGELHMKWRDAEGREHDDPNSCRRVPDCSLRHGAHALYAGRNARHPFEPAGTLNTGNMQNERTVADMERI